MLRRMAWGNGARMTNERKSSSARRRKQTKWPGRDPNASQGREQTWDRVGQGRIGEMENVRYRPGG